MDNKTIKELVAYFEARESRDEAEERLLGSLRASLDTFPINSITRRDLAEFGFDTDKITDGDMENLASQISDEIESSRTYWGEVEHIAKDFMGLPMLT